MLRIRAGPSVALVLALVALAAAEGADPPRRLAAEAQQRYRGVVEALQQGDAGPTRREFATDAARQSIIGAYADYLYAEALVRGGEPGRAAQIAEAVAERQVDRPIAVPALRLAAYAAERAGDPTQAQALLRRLAARAPDSRVVAEALYLLGTLSEGRGRLDGAAQVYREITILTPASEYADGAADRLAALERAGVTVPPVLPSQRLARAQRLLGAGAIDTARVEALALADEATEPEIMAGALEVAANALQRARRYPAAAGLLERLLPLVSAERQATLRLDLGLVLLRAGDHAGAHAALAAVDPSLATPAAQAGYLRGRVYEDAGLFDEAGAMFETTAAAFPDREATAGALWRVGWLAYLRGERVQAGQYWDRLQQLPRHAYGEPTLYWRARILDELGHAAEARSLYEAVLTEAPRGYYGLLAGARVPVPPAAVAPPVDLPADPGEALAGDPDWVRIQALQALGLLEFARAETDDLLRRAAGDPRALYGVAASYARDERYDLALRIVRRLFAGLVAAPPPDLPRAFWDIAYPFGWKREIAEAAAQARVDPFLVAAIVREESSFSPVALSRAGARGLMQLMPETARQVTARLEPSPNGEALEVPGVNVTLGTRVLAGLLQEFARPQLAIAAYNAGPQRVREWWNGRRTDDIEAFVEQIPYDETRLYVKRVMVSWAEYRRLYAD